MIQKTNIDALHKEGKSQKVITERCGCLQSAVSKLLNAKLTGRKNLGRKKVHKQQGWPQAWEYCQAKLIQTLGRASQGVDWSWSQCIKSHHAQTSSGKELPSHFWTRDNVRSILPGLWRKRTGLLLSGPKSSFQMKVNFAFHLEIKVPESGGRVERHRIHVAWSPVWSFHSQWWFGLPCHLLVLVHWFSEVHCQRSHLPGNFRALHASFCWQALWRCWFHFPAGLGTCPHCQRYQKLVQWPWCYCAWLTSKLAWPEPHRESMGYCQEEDERHQTQQCRWPEGHCQRNLGFHTPQQCHNWSPPCHAELRQ